MKKQAFSSEQYLNLQRDHILERINQFDGKLSWSLVVRYWRFPRCPRPSWL